MRKEAIVLLIVILFVGLVSASFKFVDYDVTKTKYSSQNFIEGWVKMNFDKEDATSVFTTSVDDSVELLDLLKLNNANYTCVPADCEPSYSADGTGKTSLSFDLEAGKSKIVGLKFTGEISSIDSVNFSVQSDAGAYCENQLKIDFLDDEETEKGNDKTSSDVCSSFKNYGCFESAGETEQLTIEETPYCQKINLSESAGFKIGAWIKKSDAKSLEMIVYDKDINEKAKCNLPEASEVGGEISCDVNYPVMQEEEHYICIKSKSGSTENQIKGNSNPLMKCGFFGTPIKSGTSAYQIFAQGKKFDAVGILNISGENIGQDFENYLLDKYDLNCPDGCVVPIKFISGYDQKQTVTLSELKAKYKKSSGNVIEDKFYELRESPAKVSGNEQKLDLIKAKFSVAKNVSEYGNKTFKMNFKNEEIFSEVIFIERISTIESLNPLFAAAANPTDFIVEVDERNNSKIVKYKWDFGDDKTETTTTNKITHTYDGIKNYEFKITITDENDFESYKIFNVSVGSPKDIADAEIKKKLNYIENLKSDVGNMTGFYKSSVEEILDLNNSETKLKNLESNYAVASSDDDYITIMKELVGLKIPMSVLLVEKIKSARFYPMENNIDMSVLKNIGGGDYGNLENEYKRAVNDWMIDNLEIKITYNEVIAEYEQNDGTLLNVFELNVTNKREDNYYIVLKDMADLDFEQDYSEKQEGDYVYISANDDENVVFSTTENIEFINLPVFMSAAISELKVVAPGICKVDDFCDKNAGENWQNCKDCNYFWTIIGIMALLFGVGIVIYIILQIWYKRKYESHLFKNRSSLHNIMVYVHDSKKKGIEEKEVKENLKKVGWSSEQIRYATRKYEGKNIGMPEIPSPIAKIKEWKMTRNNIPKDTNNHRKV